jgi:hypothetical protein
MRAHPRPRRVPTGSTPPSTEAKARWRTGPIQVPHLSLGQIHSALAYYWDHRDEVDHDIARHLTAVDQQRQTPTAPLRARLRARGER